MNLEGRMARCTCGSRVPSTDDGSLAFFQYRGPGSYDAEHGCKHCAYYDVAHDPEHMETLVHGPDGKRRPTCVESGKCPGYEQNVDGLEFDLFYCGCRGWD